MTRPRPRCSRRSKRPDPQDPSLVCRAPHAPRSDRRQSPDRPREPVARRPALRRWARVRRQGRIPRREGCGAYFRGSWARSAAPRCPWRRLREGNRRASSRFSVRSRTCASAPSISSAERRGRKRVPLRGRCHPSPDLRGVSRRWHRRVRVTRTR